MNFIKEKMSCLQFGRYDQFSKYNNKNISRYLREKKLLAVVPYNTLFFEACSEGTIIDYFLKTKTITDETDRNRVFTREIKAIVNSILFKLQELQMKI